MQKDLFITGTDTGVGKTVISCALLSMLKQQGKTVLGMKPIASGCQQTPQGLRNEDAEQLIRFSSQSMPYSLVNPYAYEAPIAPHIAAEQSGDKIDLEVIRERYLALSAQCDQVIVEGVGGWLVPVNETQTIADLACQLDMPVLLVVGLRLGCINHALLSYQAILHAGLNCVGWVANQVESDMLRLDENVAAIKNRIDAPLLGTVLFNESLDISDISGHLSSRLSVASSE